MNIRLKTYTLHAMRRNSPREIVPFRPPCRYFHRKNWPIRQEGDISHEKSVLSGRSGGVSRGKLHFSGRGAVFFLFMNLIF